MQAAYHLDHYLYIHDKACNASNSCSLGMQAGRHIIQCMYTLGLQSKGVHVDTPGPWDVAVELVWLYQEIV